MEEAQGLAEDLIEASAPTEERFFCAILLELIHDYGQPFESRLDLLGITEEIAERAFDRGDFKVARRYWHIASDLAAAQQEREVDPREARRPYAHHAADAFVEEAERMLDGDGGYMAATQYLRQAIEALRRVGGEDDRIERLHRRMVEFQEEMPSELVGFSHSVDISEQIEQARERVAGMALLDALRELVVTPPIPAVEHLREQAEEMADQYLVEGLFPKMLLSRTGKVVERYGPGRASEEEQREAALRGAMLKNACTEHSFTAQAFINPMRRQIVLDHPVQERHMRHVLRYQRVVSFGREELYARGLVAGFYGNLSTALHLLIPQLEHSIRVMLNSRVALQSLSDIRTVFRCHTSPTIMRRPEAAPG